MRKDIVIELSYRVLVEVAKIREAITILPKPNPDAATLLVRNHARYATTVRIAKQDTKE